MTLNTAVAYYRTSSATNVGADKDSHVRQQAAVRACAESRGLTIVAEFYDPAVSGADPVESRPGFAAMLTRLLSNGTRTVIVENASRFARDLIVQEVGYRMLKGKGIELIAADAPESFISDTPTAKLVRQILGAVSEFEKTMVVTKLRGARDRKSASLGGRRVEGAKRLGRLSVEAIRTAREIRSADPDISLRDISAKLAAAGHRSAAGTPLGASSVRRLLARE
jgi:DNA invertase Pin-like site-specific DNA recombinase